MFIHLWKSINLYYFRILPESKKKDKVLSILSDD